MSTTRRFTAAVTRAAAGRTKPQVEEFGPLRRGDLFTVTGPLGRKRNGVVPQFKFLSTTLVDGEPGWINALGPLGQRQNMRALRPEAVIIPSAYALRRQRRTLRPEAC